ncbi:MAG: translocation/assembly module TamB domain-containing protein, partial [Rhodospirillales bacterium]
MRLALRIAVAVLAILLLLVIALVAFLQTQVGGRVAARALSAAVSTPGETELRVERIGPGLPFRLALSGLSIADGDGEWLAVDGLEVRWRPLALLRGRLSIAEASAGGVRLSRLPEGGTEAEADDDVSVLPSLPLDLQVDRFAFNDVEIGPAVAGEVMALRAGGEIAAERNGQIRTEAEIVRTNGVGAEIRLSALWQRAGERLSLDLLADEPEGGLAGPLLGIAGRPPGRLTFTGDGPVTAWRGRLEGSLGEDIGISARVASEDGADGIRVAISGNTQVAALLPEAARAVAADGIGFDLALRRPDAGVLAIDRADVEANGVHFTGAGALALDDERFDDLRLTLAATDTAALAPLLAPASIEGGEVRVKLSGPWAAPAAEISADLVDLRVADASVAASALQGSLAQGERGRMEVEAEATFSGVRAGGLDVDAVLGAPPRLRLAARFEPQENTATVDRIELSAPALNASGGGAYDLGSGEGTASLRATLPDLAAFSSLSGLDLAGSAALAIDAGLTAAGVDAVLGLSSSAFRSGLAAADILLGPAPSLRAALRADRGAGQIRLDEVMLAGRGMLATATGTLEDDLVNADYRLEVPDVTPVAAASGVAASGALALDGTVSGPAGDPNATAVLTLMDGQLADVITSPVRSELTAESLITQPRGRLVATAFAPGEPLRLAVPFARDGGALRIGPIEGAGAGARLSGDLTLPRGGGPMLGAVTLRAGGEGRPLALAGHRLDGDAEVAVVLGEANGEQTVAIDGSGRSLALATPEGPLGSVESLSLRARLAGTEDPRGDVSLAIVRPTVGGLSLHGVDARLSGSAKDASYDVTARLAEDPAEALRTGGTFAQENGRSRITFAFLDGQAAGHRLDLRRPLTITQGGGETVIDGLELVAGGGTISGGGRTGASGTEGRLLLDRLPLTLARALRPDLNLTGSLDGEAAVRTEGADLAGRLALNLSDVRAGPMAQAPPLEANASLNLDGGIAAVEVRVPRLGGSPLALEASVPARVDARTLAVDVSAEAPLRGRLTWSGAVARLWELAPLPEQRLTGDADIDLALAGTVAAPELSGQASLANGRYEHFLTETIIDRLSLQARSTGAGAIALALRGNDGDKGAITGDGRITLAKGMTPLVELAVTFAEATLVRRDDITATMSGAMTFRQDEAGASLAGELTSERMDIRLIDRLPPSVVVLDVTEINLPPGHVPRLAEPAPAPAGPAIALDIAVTLPRRVFVRGRGLESEWEGDLRVSGTSADPRVVGIVAVRSGTFDFAGKRFTLETGEIGFTGGATVNPTLNVQAMRSTPDLTAVIRVIGTALEPEIELTSTPALPESEILSRVLFDKGVAKLGPVEAAQLAMALDTLASGESMSEDALSYVRNLLGLDVLTVAAGE